MKTSTFTEEQIVLILREAETGEQTIGTVCRTHGISENTFYKWRKKYGGADVSAIKRLRELELENGRLKRTAQRAPPERDLEIDVGYPWGAGDPWKKMRSAQQRRETVRQMQARALSLRRSCALCHIGHSSLRYRSRSMRRLQN